MIGVFGFRISCILVISSISLIQAYIVGVSDSPSIKRRLKIEIIVPASWVGKIMLVQF
jgi:hypothetical protein